MSTNSTPSSTVEIPESVYLGDGFTIEPPQGWETVDQRSIDNGSINQTLPPGSSAEIVEELEAVFENGVLVAFYDFGATAGYTPNITVTRQQATVYANPSAQAERTAQMLREQGFELADYRVSDAPTGQSAEFIYTIPVSRMGEPSELAASTHIVFGESATWTLTGLTSHSPESIDAAVAATSRTLLAR